MDPRDTRTKTRLGLLQGWASIAVNLFIFGLKLLFGLVLGSIALVADSIDSLFDVIGSGIVVVGFHWAQKPRDQEHPFGHGRIDLVAGLILAVLLIVVGVELSRSALFRILEPRAYVAPWWMIATIAGTIPLKEWLAIFSRTISGATASSSLEADYWFHRFDSMTSASVCVGLLLSRYGWVHADGWIALFISLLIVWTGALLVKRSISPLIGEAPSRAEVEAVERAAAAVDGVHGVHDVIIHKYGDVKLISLHIEVSAAGSVMDLHDLSERVEAAVEAETGGKVISHIDPVDRRHPAYEEARRAVEAVVVSDPEVVAFHDLRVSGDASSFDLGVDVVVRVDTPSTSYGDLRKSLEEILRRKLEAMGSATIHIESGYAGEAEVPGNARKTRGSWGV